MIAEYNPPEGWSMKTLGDFLTHEQCDQVRIIINNNLMDDLALIRALKDYFVPLREQLEANGVMPEFLAYSLAWTVIHPKR